MFSKCNISVIILANAYMQQFSEHSPTHGLKIFLHHKKNNLKKLTYTASCTPTPIPLEVSRT